MILQNHILIDCQFKTQDDVINGLIDHLQLPEHAKEIVKQREHVRSTVVPEGIAFPHCHLGDKNHVVPPEYKKFESLSAIATFKQPILWGVEPVRIVVFLCSATDFGQYIRSLAAMCKVLHSVETRNKILNASSSEEVFQLLNGVKA